MSLVWLSLGALVGFPTIALPSLQANITTHLQNTTNPNLTYYKYDLLGSNDTSNRSQSLKYENGFNHLWHLASGQAMNTNDENL